MNAFFNSFSDISKKKITLDILIKFLFFSSLSSIFFVPYKIGTYKFVGSLGILLFGISFFFNRKDFFGKENQFFLEKQDLIVFCFLFIFVLKSLIPSAIATLILFFCLYGKNIPVRINKKNTIFIFFTTISSLLLCWNLYAFRFNKDLIFNETNSNYLAILYLFLFLLGARFKILPVKAIAVVAAILLGVRNIQLFILVYFLLSIPYVKKILKLSVKKVFLIILCGNIFYFIIGALFSNVVVYKKSNTKKTQFVNVTLDRVTSGRMHLNNLFFKDSSLKDFIIGKGKSYRGGLLYGHIKPVHNSWLIIIGRHGVFFALPLFFMLYRFCLKYGEGFEREILGYLIFSSLLHGMLETYPLLIFLTLMLVGEKKDS